MRINPGQHIAKWIPPQQKGLYTMTKKDLFQERKVGLTSENQLM